MIGNVFDRFQFRSIDGQLFRDQRTSRFVLFSIENFEKIFDGRRSAQTAGQMVFVSFLFARTTIVDNIDENFLRRRIFRKNFCVRTLKIFIVFPRLFSLNSDRNGARFVAESLLDDCWQRFVEMLDRKTSKAKILPRFPLPDFRIENVSPSGSSSIFRRHTER